MNTKQPNQDKQTDKTVSDKDQRSSTDKRGGGQQQGRQQTQQGGQGSQQSGTHGGAGRQGEPAKRKPDDQSES
jgi:hypothetical protein